MSFRLRPNQEGFLLTVMRSQEDPAAERLLPGGRMLDIDVMDRQGEPVGREALGLPPRQCFVCRQPAAVCVSRKVHSREEVRQRVEELLAEARQGLGLR